MRFEDIWENPDRGEILVIICVCINLIITIPILQAMIRSMVESLSADLTTGSDLIDNAEKQLGSEQPLNEEIRPLQQQETEHQVRYFPIFKSLVTGTCDCEKLRLKLLVNCREPLFKNV